MYTITNKGPDASFASGPLLVIVFSAPLILGILPAVLAEKVQVNVWPVWLTVRLRKWPDHTGNRQPLREWAGNPRPANRLAVFVRVLDTTAEWM